MIETERLILRKAVLADASELYPIRNSEFVLKYNAMEIYTSERMIKEVQNDSQKENVWYMELKQTHHVIGVIYLHQDSLRYQTNTKELSYWMCEEESNKGYMSEALRAVIQHAFVNEKLKGITARCFDANIASRKVLEKLGFRLEGVLSNAVMGYQNIIFSDMLYYLSNTEI